MTAVISVAHDRPYTANKTLSMVLQIFKILSSPSSSMLIVASDISRSSTDEIIADVYSTTIDTLLIISIIPLLD